ncbi:MAG: hypothetical protein KKD74_09920, partial [Bacteroidetes bacterium]|nr:hypothetical protein [Bacteroidota bacterium]
FAQFVLFYQEKRKRKTTLGFLFAMLMLLDFKRSIRLVFHGLIDFIGVQENALLFALLMKPLR